MLYGRAQMYALKATDGYFCHRWWASDRIGLVMFTDPKAVTTWVKAVNKLAKKFKRPEWALSAQVVVITSLPEGLQATINPADEYADVNRMMARRTFQNW